MTGICTHGNTVSDEREFIPESMDCWQCWPSRGRKVPTSATVGNSGYRGRCLHLGERVEFRPGCGGRRCLHRCEAGEPAAVPGGVCQTCPKWESES